MQIFIFVEQSELQDGHNLVTFIVPHTPRKEHTCYKSNKITQNPFYFL